MKDIFQYPAIFTKSSIDNNELIVTFPDFPDSEITVASPFAPAELEIAQNLLLLEYDGEKFPKPTNPKKISIVENTQFISMMEIDLADYRKRSRIKKLI